MKVCKMKKKYIDMYSKREYNNSKKRDMRTKGDEKMQIAWNVMHQ